MGAGRAGTGLAAAEAGANRAERRALVDGRPKRPRRGRRRLRCGTSSGSGRAASPAANTRRSRASPGIGKSSFSMDRCNDHKGGAMAGGELDAAPKGSVDRTQRGGRAEIPSSRASSLPAATTTRCMSSRPRGRTNKRLGFQRSRAISQAWRQKSTRSVTWCSSSSIRFDLHGQDRGHPIPRFAVRRRAVGRDGWPTWRG